MTRTSGHYRLDGRWYYLATDGTAYVLAWGSSGPIWREVEKLPEGATATLPRPEERRMLDGARFEG